VRKVPQVVLERATVKGKAIIYTANVAGALTCTSARRKQPRIQRENHHFETPANLADEDRSQP